ncbi:MAG: hypothetical protein M1831_005836 [Alyxoria varia]|nr:MAG: hypothetical protein M1831_005836 [Alyxoria varia]
MRDTTEQPPQWIPSTPAARPQQRATSFNSIPSHQDFVLFGDQPDHQATSTPQTCSGPRPSFRIVDVPKHDSEQGSDNIDQFNSNFVTDNRELHSTTLSQNTNKNQHGPFSNQCNVSSHFNPNQLQAVHRPQDIALFRAMSQANTEDKQLLASGQEASLDFNELLQSDSYDMASRAFNALNSSAPSSHTVSPQELFTDPSAPNSNTLTDLTSPSLFDGSPDFNSFDNSPLFGDDNNVTTWPSLFPEQDEFNGSAYNSTPDPGNFVHRRSMERTVSGASAESSKETSTMHHRLSVTSGVNKTRRNGRQLGPIDVDEGDSKAVKRAKNTMAARKSRQKKRDVEDSLRNALNEMTTERDKWMHVAISHGAPCPDLDKKK